MKEKHITEFINLDEVFLRQVNAKLTNKKKKSDNSKLSSWKYKIIKNEEDIIEISTSVNALYTGLLEIKADFIVKFNTSRKIETKDIQDNIESILSYGGVHFTLLSSFLTKLMIGTPLPSAPVIKNEDITFIENNKEM